MAPRPRNRIACTRWFGVACIALLFSSCTNTKRLGGYWVNPNQPYFEDYKKCDAKQFRVDPAAPKDPRVLAQITVTKEDEDTMAYLKIVPVHWKGHDPVAHETSMQQTFKNKKVVMKMAPVACPKPKSPRDTGYYPPRRYDLEKAYQCYRDRRIGNDFVYSGRRFIYLEMTPTLQPITIPAKLRGPVDSLDYTGETDLTFGLGFGWRRTKHWFKNVYDCGDGRYLNYQEGKVTTVWGLFGAPIGQDLDADNTRGRYNNERTALGVSLGLFGAVEVNKISLGLALGVDHPFGNGASEWIYYNQPWFGLIIGLGLFETDEE